MQFMVYFARSTDGKGGPAPTPEAMAGTGKLMEEAFASGMIVATGQLGPTSTYIAEQAGKLAVTDGPFIEGKELIPGFTVIRVDTKQEAIEWASKVRGFLGIEHIRLAQVHVPASEGG